MTKPASFLEGLRSEYEAARESAGPRVEVEDFQAIDSLLRNAFRWLEKAITLEELVKLILGRDSAFLRRARVAGVRRLPNAAG